jgi:putative Mg2+ transporter-C (MgtC) family protein
MSLEAVDILKLLAAVLAGGIIGVERELRDKPAGLRTNVLICLGAAFFTMVSVKMTIGTVADPTRIAAQIVTGVGFLGAGAILHLESHVVGLTTAATIWVVASIGMAFGAGFFALGIFATLLTGLAVFGLAYGEHAITLWRTQQVFELSVEPGQENAEALCRHVRATHGVRCRTVLTSKSATGIHIRMVLTGPSESLDRLAAELMAQPGVHTLRRR